MEEPADDRIPKEPPAAPSGAPGEDADLAELERRLGYEFRDRKHLLKALRHSSCCSAHNESNERLEFLGDGLLSFVVADVLFRRHENCDEGELTQFRSRLVSTKGLAEVARELDLASHIRLSRSVREGRVSRRMLADCMEAVLAAIYLDGGIEPARDVIERLICSRPAGEEKQAAEPENYKSLLPQLVQSLGTELPVYKVVSESGPDHRKIYSVSVEYAGMCFPCASGPSKKEAEQRAARRAFLELLALISEKR